ncbi:DUF951 domain-containing protein [Thermaerobacter sp. FW80]|uniref:DUF951 domain-containing protein n=1 Tax=Thermaerobacter sp. FW80 TaxID=2546351 RepID=UPI000DB7C2BD|nr:DUF951 domain-containing protein [Thermaerobacter sp. FW80]PZN09359.1 MAG: DUF951 domain-containing protein [Bacillota bacterium]QBS37082.1 DUF951 domain-containing protein [Thermaerobacter sp. FW80]
MSGPKKFYLGDIVRMRKTHPCGSDRWEVLRVGMDFRIRCLGCGHLVLMPRRKFERAVRQVLGGPNRPPAGTDGTGSDAPSQP